MKVGFPPRRQGNPSRIIWKLSIRNCIQHKNHQIAMQLKIKLIRKNYSKSLWRSCIIGLIVSLSRRFVSQHYPAWEKNGYTKQVPLPEKCPNTEVFLVRIFLYLDWIQENTGQKKLRIWTSFMLCAISSRSESLKLKQWKCLHFSIKFS